jgi:hypothetical protein
VKVEFSFPFTEFNVFLKGENRRSERQILYKQARDLASKGVKLLKTKTMGYSM